VLPALPNNPKSAPPIRQCFEWAKKLITFEYGCEAEIQKQLQYGVSVYSNVKTAPLKNSTKDRSEFNRMHPAVFIPQHPL
jgi:hypothetical protein